MMMMRTEPAVSPSPRLIRRSIILAAIYFEYQRPLGAIVRKQVEWEDYNRVLINGSAWSAMHLASSSSASSNPPGTPSGTANSDKSVDDSFPPRLCGGLINGDALGVGEFIDS